MFHFGSQVKNIEPQMNADDSKKEHSLMILPSLARRGSRGGFGVSFLYLMCHLSLRSG
jgi:hypothetical protein